MVAYIIALLYGLYHFTRKYEYPLAVAIVALILFSNFFVFMFYPSDFVCFASIIIIDIAFFIALAYLIFDITRAKKDYKTSR